MLKQISFILLSIFCFQIVTAQTYEWVDISDKIPGTASFSDVFAIGDEVWITSASSTELYYSNTGGATAFTAYTTPGGFLCIHMITSDTGYAGAENGRVYRTTDGGANWTLLLPLTGAAVTSITFPPSGEEPGYCCGLDGRINSLTSTGTTQMTSGVVSTMSSIIFPVSSSEGWVCGEDVIRHYANGQWNADQSYPGNVSCIGIHFIDNSNGWIVGGTGSNGAIIHTTNGLQWISLTDPSPTTGILTAVFFLDDGLNGWAAGNFGRVVQTTDGGANWSVIDIGTGGVGLLRGIHFTSSNNGYIVGNDDKAFKYTTVTSVDEEAILPIEFILNQNYPNPFNPTTTIEFTLKRSSHVKIIVYDVLGREVETLLDERRRIGTHKVVFNGSDYTSGIYNYKLETDNFTESMQMILVK